MTDNYTEAKVIEKSGRIYAVTVTYDTATGEIQDTDAEHVPIGDMNKTLPLDNGN